jgi:hypothetical protein
MAPVTTGAISFEGFVGAAESVMRRAFSRAELGGSAAVGIKYGLIVAVLSAATLTVALAIAAKFSVLPAGFIG